MKNKVDTHETLSLFFKRNGVPPKIVMDGSKEQKLLLFINKYQEEDLHINHTVPYYPWQLKSEGTIR